MNKMEIEKQLDSYRNQFRQNINGSEKNQHTSPIIHQTKQIKQNLKTSKEVLIKNYIIMNFLDSNVALKDFMSDLERNLIEYALLISMGNQKKTASLLGVKPTALCEKIKKFKLKSQKKFKYQFDKKMLDELMSFFFQYKYLNKN